MTKDSYPMTSNEEFLSDLDALDQPMRDASDGRVPAGTYTVTVQSTEVGRSQAGRLTLKWRLQIIGPAQAGQLLFLNHTLEPDKLHFLKRDLAAIKYPVPAMREIGAIGPALQGVPLVAEVQWKGEYQNVYLRGRAQGAPAAAPAQTPAQPPHAAPQQTAPGGPAPTTAPVHGQGQPASSDIPF